MLDLVLPPVAERHEAGHQLVEVDLASLRHRDRLHIAAAGRQTLDEGSNGGDDDRRAVLVVGETAERLDALTHGLDRRAHTLEGQGLPRREVLDVVRIEQGTQVVDEALGITGRGGRDHDGATARSGGQAGDDHRPRRVGDREHRVGATQHGEQAGIVPDQLGQPAQVGGRGGVQGAGRGARRGHPVRVATAIPPPSSQEAPLGQLGPQLVGVRAEDLVDGLPAPGLDL